MNMKLKIYQIEQENDVVKKHARKTKLYVTEISNYSLTESETCRCIPEIEIAAISRKFKNAIMNESEVKNTWFKTWPENNYDKLNQSYEYISEHDKSSLKDFENQETHATLDKVLDKIPLAYSPITKQLHVLAINEPEESKFVGRYQTLNECDVSENDENLVSCWQKTSQLDVNGKKLISENCLKCDDSWESKINYSGKYGISDSSKCVVSEQCAVGAETSSFSSIVSSLSDTSPSNIDDNISSKCSTIDNDDLSIRSHCSHDSGSGYGENSKFFEGRNSWNKDNKHRGLSGFFSRNVFSWKPAHSLSSQGWRLFGKSASHAPDSASQFDCMHSATDSSSPSGIKKYENFVTSSSALILHNRPANLPAKSLDEHQKHRLEYEQIVEAAKKKEVKESKRRRKQLEQQLKFEEQLTNASRVWNNEILPKWEVMKKSRKTRDLWWSGIPPSVRGKIWKLAIGNELNITYQLYEICVARAQERLKRIDIDPKDDNTTDVNKESSVELIQLDISRTFPQLCIFQKGGPYYDILHCLLGAYVCYRPDVGYVQGMSFIAAVLILNLEPADAFICFANLLNRPCHMAFFSLNQSLMNAYYDTYNGFFKENLPKLNQHFQESSLTPDLYLLDWLYSVFAKAMPLDIACRVWDVFLRDGEEFLFRTALGILHLYQDKLLKLDFINGAQFLTKLPENLSADLLFKSIESIKMCIGKIKFSQVLSNFVEKHSSR